MLRDTSGIAWAAELSQGRAKPALPEEQSFAEGYGGLYGRPGGSAVGM